MLLRNCFVVVLIIFVFSNISAQVNAVEYYMKYDTSTCWYDFHIVVTDGEAEPYPHRIQFSAQYTFLYPFGSTATITELHNPKLNNSNGQSTTPQTWTLTTSADYPLPNPTTVFQSTTVKLNPTGSYDTLATQDTVKLFSVDITTPNTMDHSKVRLFNNDTDPNSSMLGGGDFSNGFTIGGLVDRYDGNSSLDYAPPSTVGSYSIDTSGGSLIIDIEPESSSCQNILSYQWYGPSSFTSTTEDVSIASYDNSKQGLYTVIIFDDFGYKDTTYIEVGSSIMPYVLLSENIRIEPTQHNIGVHLPVIGDDNLNCVLDIKYRMTGTTNYLESAQANRAHDNLIVDGSSLNRNFAAGSITKLSPNTKYDLQLTITDPDGITFVIDTTVNTELTISEFDAIDTIYVTTGSSGGDGTISNPYQGIQNGINNATPGDVVLVLDGLYSPFSLLSSGENELPIYIKAKNLHGATIDGGNTNTGIITLGKATSTLSNIIIDGFVIQNGKWGIDAQNTQDILIKNNKVLDVDNGFVNRRELGLELNQEVCNNEFVGRTTWPQTDGNIPSERGIDVRGNRNIICNNSISNFGDGISTDGPLYGTSYGLDIFGNYISKIVDDLIEIDGIVSNARVYHNKLMNGRAGISIAPIFGGPAYVYRNEIINTEYSAFKLNRSPTGVVINHNTILNGGYGMSSPSGWQNTNFENNLILSDSYVYEEYDLVTGGVYNFNYNGYYSNRNGTSAQPWFKWDNIKYNSVADLQSASIESNSITVGLTDFTSANIPTAFDIEILNTDNDLVPTTNATFINDGKVLNNINLGIVHDNLPDLGAHEYGNPIVNYGANFTSLCDLNDLSVMTWNGSNNKGWFEKYNWTPCGVPQKFTTVNIPNGLARYPLKNTPASIKNMNIFSLGGLEIYKTDLIIGN